jgi:hypothetical protein
MKGKIKFCKPFPLYFYPKLDFDKFIKLRSWQTERKIEEEKRGCSGGDRRIYEGICDEPVCYTTPGTCYQLLVTLLSNTSTEMRTNMCRFGKVV